MSQESWSKRISAIVWRDVNAYSALKSMKFEQFWLENHKKKDLEALLRAQISDLPYGVKTPEIERKDEIQDSNYCRINAKGSILEHRLEKGTPVTSVEYREMLVNKLKQQTSNSYLLNMLAKEVLFWHIKTSKHPDTNTTKTVVKLDFNSLEHSTFTPDLTPSDDRYI